MKAIKKPWRRYRTVFYLAVLMLPMKQREIARDLRPMLDQFIPLSLDKGWNAPTTAVVIVSAFMRQMIARMDLLQRERRAADMRDHTPQGLADELRWFIGLKNGSTLTEGMDPFIYRFNYMNGMLAHWLVREKTIDIFTKGLFVQTVAQALTSVDSQTMDEEFAALAERIGSPS